MRHIVLDTETTGLDPNSGHRIVEIGCVELINHIPSGRTFHSYLNPEREMPPEASNIHGLTDEFLSDKPLFSQVVSGFLEFIAEDQLIIHNAGFDMAFLNAELQRHGFTQLARERAIDTVIMARKKFPGAPASLDALCKRFSIDNAHRTLHGALLDARLLADVYLELSGGRQTGFTIDFAVRGSNPTTNGKKTVRPARAHVVPKNELAAHEKALGKINGALWAEAKEAG
jgi:DNA polymerase-3 subunit epsilon